MEPTRYDLTARRVARLDPAGFFCWLLTAFAQHMRFAGWLDPRSTPEGADPEVTGDTVARLEALHEVGPPWMFPVEFQTVPDPGMFGRLLKQIGEWWNDLRPDELPGSRYQVSAAVVNLTGTKESAPASREYKFPTPDELNCGCKVRERWLAEESADANLAQVEREELRPIILALIPCMQGAGEEGIITRWVKAAKRVLDVRLQADLGSMALTLASLKDWFPAWKEALKEWNMVESPYVLELQREARLEATRDATLKTMREALKKFLKGRFGALPLELAQRIDALTDQAKLDELVEAAGRVEKLNDLSV